MSRPWRGVGYSAAAVRWVRVEPVGVFTDVEAVGDAAAQFGDMADEADGAVVGAEGVEDVEDLVEGVFVEGAEAFVDEEGVQGVAAGFVGDDVGQAEGEGQGGEEGFAAGEGVGLCGRGRSRRR